jgi:FkbM family methyltransferase
MKKFIVSIIKKTGLLPYLHVLREKYFPTKYYKNTLLERKKYVAFYSQFIQTGDLVFDIGAHRGHRTGIFLALGAKVVAVEPQEDCYKYLRFKYGKRIQIENCGIAGKEGTQEMFINNASSLSTFSTEWVEEATAGRFSETKWIDKKWIEIKTIDLLIEKYGTPKFCKIDVETYEYEVLKGLSTTIEFISFEFMMPESFVVLKNCINHVIQLNPSAKFNYCIGDNIKLELENWIGSDRMDDFVNEKIFNSSSWGDIYVKMGKK